MWKVRGATDSVSANPRNHGGVVEASDLVGGERDVVRPFAAQAGGGDLAFS
jgi:hypothetical protein